MLTPILHPNVSRVAGISTIDTGWKLNQELQATVVNSTKGKMLRIEGNNYSPLNTLHLDPGKTLQLKVTALSPFIELALLNKVRNTERLDTKPGIILSEKILQTGAQNAQTSSASLLRVMQLVSNLSTQSLPPATAAVIAALHQRIVGPGSLASSSTLKPALWNAGLLLEGSLDGDSPETGNNMKGLLLQLLRSLGGADSTVGKTGLPGRLPDNYGLALYQKVDMAGYGLAMLMAREMEEELLRMFRGQKHNLDATEDNGYRWLFELPVNFQDRMRSLSIRIRREKTRNRQSLSQSIWTAELSFELPGCGDLHIKLSVDDLTVAIAITCTNNTACKLLERRQLLLRSKLSYYGLTLSGLRSTAVDSSEFERSHAANSDLHATIENVPLKSFAMHENAKPLEPVQGIPDALYCSMASLFSYIFELEKDLGQVASDIEVG